MFNNAIEVGEGRAVIVTFEPHDDVVRLTPHGFVETDAITCFIYEAKGMLLIGSGDSLRAAEDAPDDEKGIKLAFERAVKQAFQYDREARTALFSVFMKAMRDVRDSDVDEVLVPVGVKTIREQNIEALEIFLNGAGAKHAWVDDECPRCEAMETLTKLKEAA